MHKGDQLFSFTKEMKDATFSIGLNQFLDELTALGRDNHRHATPERCFCECRLCD